MDALVPVENAPDPVDVFVGRRVQAFRVSRRLTLHELGQSIGVTFQQIQKYERGTNRVSASKLWGISKALGVPVEEFFPGADTEARAIARASSIARLGPGIRKAVVDLIDAAVEETDHL